MSNAPLLNHLTLLPVAALVALLPPATLPLLGAGDADTAVEEDDFCGVRVLFAILGWRLP
jgi:hypothetical protein